MSRRRFANTILGIGVVAALVGGFFLSRRTGMGFPAAVFVTAIVLEVAGVVVAVLVLSVRRTIISRTPPEAPPKTPDYAFSQDERRTRTPINGVFMGGGARGVVYAGALDAMNDGGFEFAAVAGSSAGAITALLVAARLTPEQFRAAARQALRHVTIRPFLGFVPYVNKALYSVDRLGRYLDTLLAQQVEWLREGTRAREGEVTFLELYAASGIELDIVAMDLATQQPVVFNHITAPNCQVREAVLASCAIPCGMRSRRLDVLERGTTPRTHRLVDGGAWANYPAFVFEDHAFREYWSLGPPPAERTIGFALDNEPSARIPESRDVFVRMSGPHGHESDRGGGSESGTVGALLNWPLLRFLTFVAFPVLLVCVAISWLALELRGYFISFPFRGEPRQDAAILILLFALSMFVSFSLVFFVLLSRFGREVFDVGLPSLLAASSVGVSLPRWIGTGSDPVVVLNTPKSLLKTTAFNLSDPVVDAVITRANYDTKVRLHELWPDDYEQPESDPPDLPESTSSAAAGERPGFVAHVYGVLMLSGVVLYVFALGVDNITYAMTPGHALRVAFGVVALGLTSLALVGAGVIVRSQSFKKLPKSARTRTPIAAACVLLAAGVALFVSAYGAQPYSPSAYASAIRYQARVIASQPLDAGGWRIDVVSEDFGGALASANPQYCGTRGPLTCVSVLTYRQSNANPGTNVTILQIPGWKGLATAGDEYRLTIGSMPSVRIAFALAFLLGAAACIRRASMRRRLADAVNSVVTPEPSIA